MGGKHAHMEIWTSDEDALLRELIAVHGTRWLKIANAFEGRSAASIRNRWNRLSTLKRRPRGSPRPVVVVEKKTVPLFALNEEEEEVERFDFPDFDTLSFLIELGFE